MFDVSINHSSTLTFYLLNGESLDPVSHSVVGIPEDVADYYRCPELRKRITELGMPSPFGRRCTRFLDFGLNSCDHVLRKIHWISMAVDY